MAAGTTATHEECYKQSIVSLCKDAAMYAYLLASMLALLLSACATTPAALSGGPFPAITPRMAQQRDTVGERVRWGGVIVSTMPTPKETCIEILSRPLDTQGRPRDTDQTDGRFISCAQGFRDPAVYAPGREVTVIGTLAPSVVRKIGDFDYHYPSLPADVLYLWPKREEYLPPPYYYDPFWDPFWRPWPYYRWPYY